MPTVRSFALATLACITASAGIIVARGPRLVSAAPLRCSTGPAFLGYHSGGSALVLAVTGADTVLAREGDVRSTGRPGHNGSGTPREVFGQVVRIDSVEGRGAERVRAAIHASSSRNGVMVPWDYDASCAFTYWSKSARWVEPGRTAAYVVHLRRESSWVDGLPTFDVFDAAGGPYPEAAKFVRGWRSMPAVSQVQSLTAAELFDLWTVLGSDAVGTAPAQQRLAAWRERHPELARRYPADLILSGRPYGQ